MRAEFHRGNRISKKTVIRKSNLVGEDLRILAQISFYLLKRIWGYMRCLTLADKRGVEVSVFLAEVEVKGRKGPAFVAELETPKSLLGVYALETLGFKVNPRTGEIEEISPERGYLLTAEVSEEE